MAAHGRRQLREASLRCPRAAQPGIAAANIRGDAQVSEQDTQLGLGSSQVLYGNLLLIPIDNALAPSSRSTWCPRERSPAAAPAHQGDRHRRPGGDRGHPHRGARGAVRPDDPHQPGAAHRTAPHGRRTTPGDGHGGRAGPGAPAGGGDPVLRGRRGAGLRRLRHVRGQGSTRPGPTSRRPTPPVGRGAWPTRLAAALPSTTAPTGTTTSTTSTTAVGENTTPVVFKLPCWRGRRRVGVVSPQRRVSSLVARRAITRRVAGSNPAPATKASAGQAPSP